MWEFVTNNLTAFLGTLSLGSIGTLATVKWTQMSAKGSAMKQFQDVYQGAIKDLQNDKDLLKKELYDLRKTVELHYREIQDLKGYECVLMDCVYRERRPIKLTELIYEKDRQDSNSL